MLTAIWILIGSAIIGSAAYVYSAPIWRRQDEHITKMLAQFDRERKSLR